MPSPHDFLLHLRTRRPDLARRLDGIRGMGLSDGELAISVPEGSWSHRELADREVGLAGAVRDFFGGATALRLDVRGPDPEALPLPVLATKTWNYVAFCAWEGHQVAVMAVRKTAYAERWLAAARESGEGALLAALAAEGEALVRTYAAPEAEGIEGLFPRILEDLCELARGAMSYAQLVAAFPGDGEADRLEGRLYAVKEWGTHGFPPAILQRYVGRLHYVCPLCPPLGIRIARRMLAQVAQEPSIFFPEFPGAS